MYIGTQAEVPSSGLRGAGTASTILTRDWLYAWIQYGKSRDPCVLLPTKQPGSSRRIFTTIPKRVTSGADLVIHPQTHADLQNVPDILLHAHAITCNKYRIFPTCPSSSLLTSVSVVYAPSLQLAYNTTLALVNLHLCSEPAQYLLPHTFAYHEQHNGPARVRVGRFWTFHYRNHHWSSRSRPRSSGSDRWHCSVSTSQSRKASTVGSRI